VTFFLIEYVSIAMRPVPLWRRDGSAQRAGWRRAFRLFDLVAQEGGVISSEQDFLHSLKKETTMWLELPDH
jgi:hypothetical protein